MSGAPGVRRRSGRSAAPSPGEAPRSFFAPPDASPFAPVTQANVALGLLVQRGVDWKWENQDGGAGSLGSVSQLRGDSGEVADGWVRVVWFATGQSNAYRCGHANKHDLLVAPAEGRGRGSALALALATPGLRVCPALGSAVGREAALAARGAAAGGTVTSVVVVPAAGREGPGGRRRGAEADDSAVVSVRWDAARSGDAHAYTCTSRSFPLRTEAEGGAWAPRGGESAGASPLPSPAPVPAARAAASPAPVLASELHPGLRVRRGPHWARGAEFDAATSDTGTVLAWADAPLGLSLGGPRTGWVHVSFPPSSRSSAPPTVGVFRVGAGGRFELAHAEPVRAPSRRAQREAHTAFLACTGPLPEVNAVTPITVGDMCVPSPPRRGSPRAHPTRH